MTYRKKLIEVSLPLEDINKASYRENYIYKGNPSAIHKWWAQRPFAASRAVLFSSLIDDPSEYLNDEEEIIQERNRIFLLLEELIQWESMNNSEILDKAKLEIAKNISRREKLDLPIGKSAIEKFLNQNLPPLYDPFAGGGTIPLEGLRLGMKSIASDINPIAVLINKCLIELCPKFSNYHSVHPLETNVQQSSFISQDYIGARGIAEDVIYYGNWLISKAKEITDHLYPSTITQNGKSGKVIAWLWARTIKCPNPNCMAIMPLMNSFALSTKDSMKRWANPHINRNMNPPEIQFEVKDVKPKVSPPKVGKGANFRCLCCEQIAPEDYLRNQFINKQVGKKLISTVVITENGREYFNPTIEHQDYQRNFNLEWTPDFQMDVDCPDLVSGRGYGISKWDEIFTDRQLFTLGVFIHLLENVQKQVEIDLDKNNNIKIPNKENKEEYSRLIKTLLAFACDKYALYGNSFVTWYTKENRTSMLFSLQAIPMVWDFVENYPFSDLGGSIQKSILLVADAIEPLNLSKIGDVAQQDAVDAMIPPGSMVCTDPPYYDNISYSVLSDFFYVWLRKALRNDFPEIFSTILVPKEREIIAASYRFGGDQNKAKSFFENKLGQAFSNIQNKSNEEYPTTIFYAYRQKEEDEFGGKISTGWESMLEALIKSGFVIIGTWPFRTERSGRSISIQTNSLETSVVIVCRKKHEISGRLSRKDFISKLKTELPKVLIQLKQGNIAPVDLAQASIGPGIGIFSKYDGILETDGTQMTVRSALALINQTLDDYLSEQEGDFDIDTRWALAWYDQYGIDQGPYGVAEILSKAKNTGVQRLVQAGFLEARAGKVRLLKRDELDRDWDPLKDKRITVWEAMQYLIKALDENGEKAAGALLSKLGAKAEAARDLAYRLYTICERKGWAQEALAYNMLVVAWPRIKEIARSQAAEQQERLL